MDLESRLAVAENRIIYYENIMNKLEIAIDKMSEASCHISKMLAVHEQRLDTVTKNDEMIISMVEAQKEDLQLKLETIKIYSEEEVEEIKEKINKVQSQLEDLQKLRWLVNGVIIAVSITFAAATGFFQWLLTPGDISDILDGRPAVEHFHKK